MTNEEKRDTPATLRKEFRGAFEEYMSVNFPGTALTKFDSGVYHTYWVEKKFELFILGVAEGKRIKDTAVIASVPSAEPAHVPKEFDDPNVRFLDVLYEIREFLWKVKGICVIDGKTLGAFDDFVSSVRDRVNNKECVVYNVNGTQITMSEYISTLTKAVDQRTNALRGQNEALNLANSRLREKIDFRDAKIKSMLDFVQKEARDATS